MHAITVSTHGGPDVLQYTEVPEPQPGRDQVLVAIDAIGVNFIDTYFRRGLYPKPTPYVPGSEAVGTVVAVGDDVRTVSVGDRIASVDVDGAYADLAVVAADRCVAVPDGVDDATAASILLQGMTAHYLLNGATNPEPGSTVVVHAGAGGVGLILTQLAVAKQLRVIATTSDPIKAQLSKDAGAEHVLEYDGFADRVRELTDGVGAQAVYDGVGKDTFDDSIRATAVRGTVALYGAASGPVPPFDLQSLNPAGSLFVTRPTLAHYVRTPQELAWRAGEVMGAVDAGTVKIRVGQRFPLADASDAHSELEARRTTGSTVLIP